MHKGTFQNTMALRSCLLKILDFLGGVNDKVGTLADMVGTLVDQIDELEERNIRLEATVNRQADEICRIKEYLESIGMACYSTDSSSSDGDD